MTVGPLSRHRHLSPQLDFIEELKKRSKNFCFSKPFDAIVSLLNMFGAITTFAAVNFLMQITRIWFVYSEKATRFCEISNLLLSTVHTDKSKVEISQNFVAFSEYMNFKKAFCYQKLF